MTTMMEPVAYLYTGGGREPEASARKFQDITIWVHNRTEEPLVRLSDAEARIADLEDRLRGSREAADYMRKALEMQIDRTNVERARAEAYEALLKEAGKALEPFAYVVQRAENAAAHYEHDHVAEVPDSKRHGPMGLNWGHLRAARAIHHKIGVKDE